MQHASDMDLLRQYAGGNSDAAFAALVSRHVNLVYSAALRKAGNPHAAEEITQAVFIILAQKAGRIPNRTILPGWLYQTARLTAANFLKREIRRVRREQEAYMLSQTDLSRRSETEADEIWQQLAPLLEDAMGQLGDKDRAAVVLRFFGGKSFAEVAAVAGVSENAAKKRVGHALEKLRKFFLKRGIASTAETIAGAISAHSVQAAPVALAKSVTVVAIAKGSIVTASILTLVKGTIKVMTYAKLKLALGISMAVLLAGGAVTVALSDGGNKAAPPASGGLNSTPTNLVIASEFVEVPDNLLRNLGVQWQPMDSGGAIAMLTQSQHAKIFGTFKQNRNVTVLGQPRIAFQPSPGVSHQGAVAMTKFVKIAGTNAQVGTILDVGASLSSDSKFVNLNLTAEWRELVDASALHDGSQNAIRTTKATTVTTLALIPGQTILIQEPINANGLALGGSVDGSKSLLVFVTPQLSRVVLRFQRITPANGPKRAGVGGTIH